MAGHSKFHNIKFRKERQDQKRSVNFEKVVREIMAAVKIGGSDVKSNSRLKHSLQKARSLNLPKDRIDKALKKGADKKDTSQYTEERFEAFIGSGAGVIVETLTDNKNRTVSELKTIFNRNKVTMANSGCVTHMFNYRGIIHYAISVASADKMLESAVEAGALDTVSDDETHYIYTDFKDFNKVLDFMTKTYGDPLQSFIGWVAKEYVMLDKKPVAQAALKFVEALEDMEDVQHVFTNYEITDKVYEELKNN